MSLKYRIIVIFLLLFSFCSNAKEIALVTKIRGKVTQLTPHSLKAVTLSISDEIIEDTSIVTGPRSFVRIVFLDKSVLNIGPKSKVVITEMKKNDPGIITLLKGKIRANVIKNKKSNNTKLYIQTRTAALGVRGTDFQTIYNPHNRVTNLLTFKGRVAMAKLDNEGIEKKSKSKNSDISKTKLRLDEALKSSTAVEVPRGQFSGVMNNIERVTLPVKISPVQLNTLYLNADFLEKEKGQVVRKDVSKINPKQMIIKAVDQKAPSEGFHNTSTGEFAAKSGGLIDLTSGIYVPPGRDSVFDQKTGVYLSKNTGYIDNETGEYIAPKGLILDASLGFIVMNKNKKTRKYGALLAQSNSLNNIISKELVFEGKVIDRVKVLSSLELLTKESLVFSLKSFKYKNDSVSNNLRDESSYSTEILWNHSSSGKWQPVTSISFANIEIDNSYYEQSDSSLKSLSFGVRRNLSRRWSILGSVAVEQEKFLAFFENNSVVEGSIEDKALTKFKLLAEGELLRTKRHVFDTRLEIEMNLAKNSGNLNVDKSFGLGFEFGYKYWVKQTVWVRGAVWALGHEYHLSNSVFSLDESIDKSGINLEVGFIF